MKELLSNLISNPILALIATIITWIIIYKTLTFIKLNKQGWKKLEYFWLSVGLLGLLSLVNKKQRDFYIIDNFNLEDSFNYHADRIQFLVREVETCYDFVKSTTSPTDFAERQEDQDMICKWAKKYRLYLDSLLSDTIATIPKNTLETNSIKNIKFKTTQMNYYLEDFLTTCSEANKCILKYNKNLEYIKDDIFDWFYSSIGILFLILAFGTRFAIATYNVVESKTHK